MDDAEFKSHLKKCVELCREDYDGELCYRNLYVTSYAYFLELYNYDPDNTDFGKVVDFLNDGFWEYLKTTPDFQEVKLYSLPFEGSLDFYQGDSDRKMKERVGYVLAQLPCTLDRINESAKSSRKPFFRRLHQCERGIIGSISFGNGEIIVIKALNGDDEEEVSKYLGDLSIGPKVYETGEDAISEEFIRDPKLSQIRPMFSVIGIPIYRRDKPAPEFSGRVMGNITRRIHKEAGIVYANRFWDHVMVGENIRIIDLENAHFGDDFETDIERIESELSWRYSKPGVKRAMKAFNQEYN